MPPGNAAPKKTVACYTRSVFYRNFIFLLCAPIALYQITQRAHIHFQMFAHGLAFALLKDCSKPVLQPCEMASLIDRISGFARRSMGCTNFP
jgi:hypothetical protein